MWRVYRELGEGGSVCVDFNVMDGIWREGTGREEICRLEGEHIVWTGEVRR